MDIKFENTEFLFLINKLYAVYVGTTPFGESRSKIGIYNRGGNLRIYCYDRVIIGFCFLSYCIYELL